MIDKQVMRELECFKELTDEQVFRLAEIANERTFEEAEYIQKQNDTAEALYIVISGRVAVEMELPRHRRIAVDFVEKGGFFGWSALVAPHVLTASCLTAEKTTLAEIPREPLRAVLTADDSLRAAIMEMIAYVIANRLKDTRLQLSYLLGWD